MLYALDTGYPHDDCFDFLASHRIHLDALITDATYGMLSCADNGHMDFRKIMNFRQKLYTNGIIDDRTVCYVDHICHVAAIDTETLKQAIPKEFLLPADGDVFVIKMKYTYPLDTAEKGCVKGVDH